MQQSRKHTSPSRNYAGLYHQTIPSCGTKRQQDIGRVGASGLTSLDISSKTAHRHLLHNINPVDSPNSVDNDLVFFLCFNPNYGHILQISPLTVVILDPQSKLISQCQVTSSDSMFDFPSLVVGKFDMYSTLLRKFSLQNIKPIITLNMLFTHTYSAQVECSCL